MKKTYILTLLSALALASCNFLDTKVDVMPTWEDVERTRYRAFDFGMTPYGYLRNGFTYIDNNIDAAMSDEAEQTSSSSNVQLFNNASWNAVSNPDDIYENNYTGIRAVNFFLDYTTGYKQMLAKDRDTISSSGKHLYYLELERMAFLRAESKVLRAFFYFDLVKRYGDVPFLTEVLGNDDKLDLPRTPYTNIINYSVEEIDAALDSLQVDWKQYNVALDGRLTRGAALALKSRMLLYAASPLFNENNDTQKWVEAAKAAYDVIRSNQYRLSNNYQSLFLEANSINDNEIIFSIRGGQTNQMERLNYPIGTPGGASGITPSHNLVAAYEYKGIPVADNPYANRDPRLAYSIVTNNSQWNGRTINISPGAMDSRLSSNTSKTGYYLKKFLNPQLNLLQDESKMRNWVVFRYAEILLNYAEAMNEAYGPDDNNGNTLSARQAINLVRKRAGVEMPDVVATTKEEMRDKIKHERRIELAFEGHRFWDLRRWKDAETVLNQPLLGVRADYQDGNYVYTTFEVERRKFIAPKMYKYPIPQVEINKSQLLEGNLNQSPEWQ